MAVFIISFMVLEAMRGRLMDHSEGAGFERGDRVEFDCRVRLEFHDTQLSSDGGW